ncbi:MAG: endonuclease/exonuclease/phosphatase family protein, partial [Candidatus Thiodiazotropha taylori]|nr:endonuclease/exonuclease/phosphatase family protein [Candidatus Thiodiazotropha taylori]MCW4284917.1 endonuclease/exonuclease/phosphatase family protein [Candidatus Thiodiazotropha taylori]
PIDLNVYRARIGLDYCRLLRLKGVKRFNLFEYFVFLAMILYLSGDVEKNPGPQSDISNETSSSAFPIFEGHFSLVHYNVQSLLNKVDLVEPELSNFDVISLTETWLNDTITNQDIAFNNFQLPFRRDRIGDSHGGIAVYVKTGIPCKRRDDLELINIECMWLEVNIRNRKILVGTFYRPPNSTPLVLNEIENSIGLAVDTDIADIIVLGDFNLNTLNTQSERKNSYLCQ